MTDQTTEPIGWRTVGVHGQPPKGVPFLMLAHPAAVPLFVETLIGPLAHSDTRWIPVDELAGLPDAPTPPRTVTVELTEDDARRLADDFDDRHGTPLGRLGDACRAALGELDG